MDNSELESRVFTAYRSAWMETLNQLLVVKTQNDLLSEKLQSSEEKIQELQKQIEALRQPKPAPQVQKQEQK